MQDQGESASDQAGILIVWVIRGLISGPNTVQDPNLRLEPSLETRRACESLQNSIDEAVVGRIAQSNDSCLGASLALGVA